MKKAKTSGRRLRPPRMLETARTRELKDVFQVHVLEIHDDKIVVEWWVGESQPTTQELVVDDWLTASLSVRL